MESSDEEEEDEDNIENNNTEELEDHLGWEEEQSEDLLGGEKLSLRNLKWIATLGVGGFGRVELVTARNNNLAFALKKMSMRMMRPMSPCEAPTARMIPISR